MDKIKMILMAIVLVLAVIGGLMVFGLVAAIVQYLFFFGILVLAGWVAFKVLKKRSDAPQLQAKDSEWELENAARVIEEMKRKQLVK
jgi:hypothetical protein